MIYQAYSVFDRDAKAGYEDHGVSAYGSRRIQLSTATAFYQMVRENHIAKYGVSRYRMGKLMFYR